MTQTEIVYNVCASSVDADQPGHKCCLICLCCLTFIMNSYTFM